MPVIDDSGVYICNRGRGRPPRRANRPPTARRLFASDSLRSFAWVGWMGEGVVGDRETVWWAEEIKSSPFLVTR